MATAYERLLAAFKTMPGMTDAEAELAARGSGINPRNDRSSFPGQTVGNGGYERSDRYDFLDLEG
jgi:hypothetical protein